MNECLKKAIISVQNIIADANLELNNAYSKWNKSTIENVVLPEMQELYNHFIVGERYFKYNRKFGMFRIKQRLLQSTYIMLDTYEDLFPTKLGQAISNFQKIYYRL